MTHNLTPGLHRSPVTRLRPTERRITAEFVVTGSVVQSVPISDRTPTDGSFRPTSAAVTIELLTGRYAVELSGPLTGSARIRRGLTPTGGTRRFDGDHYSDADLHGNQLVIDAILDTLRLHGITS